MIGDIATQVQICKFLSKKRTHYYHRYQAGASATFLFLNLHILLVIFQKKNLFCNSYTIFVLK